MQYFFQRGLLVDNCNEIAKFFHFARHIDNEKKREYLESRYLYIQEMYNYRLV